MAIMFSVSEMYTCCKYLERKLTLSPNWLSEDTDIQLKAEKMYKKAKCDKVTLLEWCDKWLNNEQRQQLNNAIRAKRCRINRKKGAGTKTVTLTHEAWLILSDRAKRDKVTLSKWIITNLEQ